MDAVIFKAYLVDKLTYWFFPIIVIVLALIYLKLNLTDESRTMVCGASIFIFFVVIFYLNRDEPKLIKFDKEQVEIFYFSQPPYARKTAVYSKNELDVSKKNEMLILSTNAHVIAKIRRKALND